MLQNMKKTHTQSSIIEKASTNIWIQIFFHFSINTNVVHRRPMSVKDESMLNQQTTQQQSPPMGSNTRRRQ